MTAVMLNNPVSKINGIGPGIAKKLSGLGIVTIYDLITHLPRRYEDWSDAKTIYGCGDGDQISLYAIVDTEPVQNRNSVKSPISFRVRDEFSNEKMNVVFFNSSYIVNLYHKNDRVFIYGKVTEYNHKLQMTNPTIQKVKEGEKIKLLHPVYHLTNGVTSKQLSRFIRNALQSISNQLPDIIPQSLREQEGLCTPEQAFQYVHFPETKEQAELGRKTLAYEELILLKIGMQMFLHPENMEEKAPVVVPRQIPEDVKAKMSIIKENLGFTLTDDQRKVINEIQVDLMKDRPMNRLVQGDVGSGKTVVAVLAMAMTALNNKQAVLLAPTSVLAQQHYDTVSSLLKGSEINVALLIGKTKASLKKEIREKLKNNEASIIIGTHAVLSDEIHFRDLALVITDEQHRFGVKQREKLLIQSEEGSTRAVHNLVMTATPIPRTLAMIVYGDMATSVIRTKPDGRKEIQTRLCMDTGSGTILEAMEQNLARGEQVYIVCPRIDDDSDGLDWDEVDNSDLFCKDMTGATDLVSVSAMKKRMDESNLGQKYESAVLHGRMKEQDKLETMQKFMNGEISILISTTVIEVGVNNPNATMMVIMNADRFGLSTLHQLRGRIGRGNKESVCILATDSKTELALKRMKLMCECSDGFRLAEEDLNLRGPGDIFGTRQHGIPTLKAANLFTDAKLAPRACDSVKEVLESGGAEADQLFTNLQKLFDLRFKEKIGAL